jgi:hypothetical protein
MIIDQIDSTAPQRMLVDTAWSVLDAASDLRDAITVEVCRRVIDASLSGLAPAPSDLNVVMDFFN